MFIASKRWSEFAIEELETRAEMQMLGFGFDPSIVKQGDGSTVVVPVVDPETGSVIEYV